MGLIEVMGLAVLPSKLVDEMDAVSKAIINNEDMSDNTKTAIHKDWAEGIKNTHPEINIENVDDIIKQEIGKVFVNVLGHAGVYKRNTYGMKAFDKFIEQI